MKNPEKKECQHTIDDSFLIACDSCAGYNAACEDWEKWVKKEIKFIMETPPTKGTPLYTSVLLDLQAFIKGI